MRAAPARTPFAPFALQAGLANHIRVRDPVLVVGFPEIIHVYSMRGAVAMAWRRRIPRDRCSVRSAIGVQNMQERSSLLLFCSQRGVEQMQGSHTRRLEFRR